MNKSPKGIHKAYLYCNDCGKEIMVDNDGKIYCKGKSRNPCNER